ncbi:MAG: hypothetical protein L7S42_07935, partial [Flavobacteriaceae bacterium]|nr:hypothetical protein [Flavobacteriaceae bacterium]
VQDHQDRIMPTFQSLLQSTPKDEQYAIGYAQHHNLELTDEVRQEAYKSMLLGTWGVLAFEIPNLTTYVDNKGLSRPNILYSIGGGTKISSPALQSTTLKVITDGRKSLYHLNNDQQSVRQGKSLDSVQLMGESFSRKWVVTLHHQTNDEDWFDNMLGKSFIGLALIWLAPDYQGSLFENISGSQVYRKVNFQYQNVVATQIIESASPLPGNLTAFIDDSFTSTTSVPTVMKESKNQQKRAIGTIRSHWSKYLKGKTWNTLGLDQRTTLFQRFLDEREYDTDFLVHLSSLERNDILMNWHNRNEGQSTSVVKDSEPSEPSELQEKPKSSRRGLKALGKLKQAVGSIS